MNINWENVKEFFMKNGKKWVATSITTLMLTQPVMAKTESKNNKKTNLEEYEISSSLNDDYNINNSLVFKLYNKWKKNNSGNYERNIYTIVTDIEYFKNHNYEELLEEIRKGKMDAITSVLKIEKDEAKEKPDDYEYLSLELIGTNVLLKVKNEPYKEMNFIISATILISLLMMAVTTGKREFKTLSKDDTHYINR